MVTTGIFFPLSVHLFLSGVLLPRLRRHYCRSTSLHLKVAKSGGPNTRKQYRRRATGHRTHRPPARSGWKSDSRYYWCDPRQSRDSSTAHRAKKRTAIKRKTRTRAPWAPPSTLFRGSTGSRRVAGRVPTQVPVPVLSFILLHPPHLRWSTPNRGGKLSTPPTGGTESTGSQTVTVTTWEGPGPEWNSQRKNHWDRHPLCVRNRLGNVSDMRRTFSLHPYALSRVPGRVPILGSNRTTVPILPSSVSSREVSKGRTVGGRGGGREGPDGTPLPSCSHRLLSGRYPCAVTVLPWVGGAPCTTLPRPTSPSSLYTPVVPSPD